MLKPNTYPERENVEPYFNMEDVIEDELRMSPDGESWELCLRGLTVMYARTRIVGSFARTSRLLFHANMQSDVPIVGEVDTHLQLDNEFFSGSILGVHAATRVLPSAARKWIYKSNAFVFNSGAEYSEELAKEIQQSIDNIGNFRKEGWKAGYDELSFGLQLQVYDAAIRLCEREEFKGDPNIGTDSFTAGFTFSVGIMGEALEKMKTSVQPPV